MSLFELAKITLSSGRVSDFKIECDALTDQDWECAAYLIAQIIPEFSHVIGVPEGGLKLAAALMSFKSSKGRLLICDDVLTTGSQITNLRRDYMQGNRTELAPFGAVLFARGQPPVWVTSLFQIHPKLVEL